MEEMRIYLANLRKYNEGEIVGGWFTPPIEVEDVKEHLGLNDEYEEFAVHDYKLPFDIEEYTSIQEINRLCEMVSELPPDIQSDIRAFLTYFDSIEELYTHHEDILHYPDCDTMADVAQFLIEETGMLGEVPATLQHYIDFEAFGRDLEIEGQYIHTGKGIFEIPY